MEIKCTCPAKVSKHAQACHRPETRTVFPYFTFSQAAGRILKKTSPYSLIERESIQELAKVKSHRQFQKGNLKSTAHCRSEEKEKKGACISCNNCCPAGLAFRRWKFSRPRVRAILIIEYHAYIFQGTIHAT